MKTQLDNALELVLQGVSLEPEVYWDTQDPNNIGSAYRYLGQSGSLRFIGWANVTGRDLRDEEVAGYNIADYFKSNGAYSGPDQDGIYPVLEEE